MPPERASVWPERKERTAREEKDMNELLMLMLT
jgi:hypothetical protein